MLSGTPVQLLTKHINGEFERDVRSMNILWEMIYKTYQELLVTVRELDDAGYSDESEEFEQDLNEMATALSLPWKI